MRTLIISIFLGLATFVSPIKAQIKKPVVKPKTTLAKLPVINTINVFNESSDDATQILSDELKKLNVILDDIEEYHFYKYDENGKKLNMINNSVKKLIFNKGITAFMHTNNIDAIKEVSFSIDDKRYNKAIKKLLGYANWPAVAQSEKDTTFKSGYFIVNTNTIAKEDEEGKKIGDTYSITMKQISPYLYKPTKTMGFEAKTLTVHDNVDDIGYAIVELMKRQGIGLLYKEDELPASDNDGLLNYYTTYNFTNGITVDINTDKKRMLSEINFACNNPIVFIKLKKEFKILEFEHIESDGENSVEYYQYKNVNSAVFTKQKAITFTINSDEQANPPNLTPTPNDRFNLTKVNNQDKINIVLVNYSLSWCQPCKDEFAEINKLNGNFETQFIQVTGLSSKDTEYDTEYFSKLKMTNLHIVDMKKFDTKLIDDGQGSLPAIFYYKGNILKKTSVGFTKLEDILSTVAEIK